MCLMCTLIIDDKLIFRRYVGNRTLFDELVRTADSLASKRWIIGGNAAVMAQRMAMEGVEVMLGARLTKSMASSFDSSIKG